MFFPEVLAWEASQKVTLIAPWVASEASEVKSWTSVRDAIRSTPGACPPHPGGRTGRDEYGACVSKGQTKSNQGRKTLVESLSTPPSKAGRDTFSEKKPWLLMRLFSLLQMGANSSRTTLLKCI